MQTFFTIPSRPQKGRPTTHQPSGGAITSTPGEFIGGHARTQDERLAALARIRALTADDFAARDKETEGKKRGAPPPAPEWQKRAEREAREWFREHPEAPTDEEDVDQTDADNDDVSEVTDIDIADIDIDTDGNECLIDTGGDAGAGEEAENDDTDAWTDDPSADVDEVFKSLAARGRADRWGHRPVLGFENGAPLGASTADICYQGPGRTKGKKEMTRADEARIFQQIRQVYPLDGFDYKVLCYLCNPDLSKLQIGDLVGRTDSAIRAAARRIRKQSAAGKFRTRRGGGATGINMDDRQEVGEWLAKPLPKAASGRKKKGIASTKQIRIRIPARLRLAPLVAVVATRAPRPYKPRRPRARFVDPGQVDMFAFDMAA